MFATTTSVVVVAMSLAGPAAAQNPVDTAEIILNLHRVIERRGPEIGPRIWPGFRPDTIPTLYVIAHRSKLLVQWRHPWPEGFRQLGGRVGVGVAGSQMVSLPSGRFISFNSVDSTMSPGLVLGTSLHEAFHSFERSSMKEGQTFGSWENAMLVGSYPVFDIENEAGVALEGRLLRRALESPDDRQTARYAREFLAVRAKRQAALGPEYSQFERSAEMNEGLAQYALIKGLQEVGRMEGGSWVAAAHREARVEIDLLDSLLSLGQRSVRRRFYATGSAMALILDRLNATWKQIVIQENLDLQETLAQATGFTVAAADSLYALHGPGIRSARHEAGAAVEKLRSRRIRQADSILAVPGFRITLDASRLGQQAIQWCGFDPQNTLQTGDGRTVHMRFLRVCIGSSVGEFDHAVVQRHDAGTIALVIDSAGLSLRGEGGQVAVPPGASADVRGLRLVGAGVSIEAAQARVRRTDGGLTVSLLP